MNRLTYKEFEGTECEPYVYGGIEYYGDSYGGEVINKLAEYEDAEEKGLLLKLSCKVGDKIWAITSTANYSLGEYAEVVLENPQEKKIQSITFSKNGIGYHVKDRTYGIGDFGKTVFLTQKEAEQALEKMKEV